MSSNAICIFPAEVSWRAHILPPTDLSSFDPGERYEGRLVVRNAGTATWESQCPEGKSVTVLLQVSGLDYNFYLPHDVGAGEEAQIDIAFEWPIDMAITSVRIDLVKQNVGFFSELGSEPLLMTLTDARANPTGMGQTAYAVEYLSHQLPKKVRPRSTFGFWVRLRNTGTLTWPCGSSSPVLASIRIGGEIVMSTELPHAVAPGDICDLHMVVNAPAQIGRHTLMFGLVHHCIAHFRDYGVDELEVRFAIDGEPMPDADLHELATQSNWSFYHPAAGISALADGTTLPRFLEQARGPHVWDTSGRRFIDYTIGWGCALLGHGNDIVESAVRRSMRAGPTLPLPHRIEMEVTDALCRQAEIPCAEAVAFGKNGSDVCTLAIRLARVCTGRKTVLVYGYHGWQDWYAEPLGFMSTGVPERTPPLVVRVETGRMDTLLAQIKEHRADLAAVMMEPAGASGGPRMVAEDIDRPQLEAIAHATREAGALLIFDEVITGFRYRHGSVQKATGVVPDLACFGKALANGFPLSALVGRVAVMKELSRAFYGPTFKGEVYALAAAMAALRVYRTEPVVEHVWEFGQLLQQGLRYACQETGVNAVVAGPPFRCVLHFEELDTQKRRLLRTLYLQELLRRGVITYSGVMLPSYAHRDMELEHTLSAAAAALQTVSLHARGGNEGLHRAIEMPLLATEA